MPVPSARPSSSGGLGSDARVPPAERVPPQPGKRPVLEASLIEGVVHLSACSGAHTRSVRVTQSVIYGGVSNSPIDSPVGSGLASALLIALWLPVLFLPAGYFARRGGPAWQWVVVVALAVVVITGFAVAKGFSPGGWQTWVGVGVGLVPGRFSLESWDVNGDLRSWSSSSGRTALPASRGTMTASVDSGAASARTSPGPRSTGFLGAAGGVYYGERQRSPHGSCRGTESAGVP